MEEYWGWILEVGRHWLWIAFVTLVFQLELENKLFYMISVNMSVTVQLTSSPHVHWMCLHSFALCSFICEQSKTCACKINVYFTNKFVLTACLGTSISQKSHLMGSLLHSLWCGCRSDKLMDASSKVQDAVRHLPPAHQLPSFHYSDCISLSACSRWVQGASPVPPSRQAHHRS